MTDQTNPITPMASNSNDGLEKGPANAVVIQEGMKKSAPPDGGTKAWLTVLGSFAANMCSFGWTNCLGVFQAEYERDLLKDYASSQVAWITSTQFFFMFVFSPLSGYLFDNYGPRLPIMLGSIMHVSGLMMLSLSSSYYQIMLSQSVCSGLGLSLFFTPSLSAPQTWFAKRRALALGLCVSGSAVGGVVFPLMTRQLIPQVGFAWTIRICAFLIFALLASSNLTISSYLVHGSKSFSLAKFFKPLRELNFVIFCLAVFFFYWGMFIPFNYIVTHALYRGMSPSEALSLVPIMNGVSFVGRILPTYAADKLGRFNVMIISLILSTIFVCGIWLPVLGTGALYAFAALFGFSSGANIGLGTVLVASISPMDEVGVRLGIVLVMAAIATLTGPPAAGGIVAAEGRSYVGASLMSGISFVAATIGMVCVRVRIGDWNLSTKI